jgi:4-hydroxy-tetrahydrodipicolinate synthase
MQGKFGDLITAMITPFDPSGKVDLKETQRLAAHLLDNGSDGLVITGSTGESPTLSDEEKSNLWKAVVEVAGGKAAVVAGTGTYDTAHSIHLTKEAEKAGVDAALVVTPYYNRPPQEGLVAHFTAVAESSGLPVILYDIPVRSALKIDHDTLVRLSGHTKIVAVKDACGSRKVGERYAG